MEWVREPVGVELFHEIPRFADATTPAVCTAAGAMLTYGELEREVLRVAAGLQSLGVEPGERVLINLPKSLEMVITLFAVTRAGAIAVPTNPNLAAPQLGEIIEDCAPVILISTGPRLEHLGLDVAAFASIRSVVVCGADSIGLRAVAWQDLEGVAASVQVAPTDLAAILYTSGSAGMAKGVALTHENLVLGAKSVAHYLGNSASDRILAVLPLSFDAGLSQVTTALLVGGQVVLLDYVFARDVVSAIGKYGVTGLTGVPSLWQALAAAQWPPETGGSLRYIANTGGRMPPSVLDRLMQTLPHVQPYLMYGLTEAFRSTYLPPEQARVRPHSIGKAIPNAEVFVLREDGGLCEPFEHGEIVHVGPLVSQGYWRDGASSYARFSSAPACATVEGRAVWSGDIGYCDDEGYLYFVSRRDEVMKISGYRLSPVEVEAAAAACELVDEACAFGVEEGGREQIWLAASPRDDRELNGETASWLSGELTRFMVGNIASYAVPRRIHWLPSLPKDLNGKVNRASLKAMVLEHLRPA